MRLRLSGLAGVTTTLLLLAGCASTTPPASTIRSSAATAPADLQLLCASEAATRLNVSSSGVLPIASRPGIAGGTYEVDVKLPDGQALCVIDDRGTVVSLGRV